MSSNSAVILAANRPVCRTPEPAARARPPATRSPDSGSLQVARRLARELELLEASLSTAERAAIECQTTRFDRSSEASSDVTSRRAELERREIELQDRQRAIERQRILLEQARERLTRGKESLKRAMLRFRGLVAERTDDLDARERRLAASHAELLESRRDFTREQIRLKTLVRESFQGAASSAELPDD